VPGLVFSLEPPGPPPPQRQVKTKRCLCPLAVETVMASAHQAHELLPSEGQTETPYPVPRLLPGLGLLEMPGTWSWSSGEMPGPVSLVATRRRSVAPLAVGAHAQDMPPFSVNLTALPSRVIEDLSAACDIGHETWGNVRRSSPRERDLFSCPCGTRNIISMSLSGQRAESTGWGSASCCPLRSWTSPGCR